MAGARNFDKGLDSILRFLPAKKKRKTKVWRSHLNLYFCTPIADVAKLVDALDLGSSAARHGGSSPFIRTNQERPHFNRMGPFIFIKLEKLESWKFNSKKKKTHQPY